MVILCLEYCSDIIFVLLGVNDSQKDSNDIIDPSDNRYRIRRDIRREDEIDSREEDLECLILDIQGQR